MNPEEAILKSHKFLIQARITKETNQVNWNDSGTEDYKISAKIIADLGNSREEVKFTKEIELEQAIKENTQSLRPSIAKNTFEFLDSNKEEVSGRLRKTMPAVEILKESPESPERNKKFVAGKLAEQSAANENLKNELEKASAKLKFSRDLEVLTKESTGGYTVLHLLGALLLGFLIGYYIL